MAYSDKVVDHYVCPFCGRVVDTLETDRCPGCFTPAGRFLRPA